MGSKTFTMPSGATLFVSKADYDSACALKTAILNEVRGLQLNGKALALDFDNIESLRDLASQPEVLSLLLDKAVALAASPGVEAAMWRCGARALYGPDQVRFTREIMDDPKLGDQAAEDLYRAFIAIAEVNVLPFFKSLFTGSKGLRSQAPAAPGSPASA